MASNETVNARLDSGAVHPGGDDQTGTVPCADQGEAPGWTPLDGHPDQTAPGTSTHAAVRSWPLLILALPAAIAIWSGWVGIGQMTGFGEMHPLPGIWDSLRMDTAVTLPTGVEAYAAFALRAWLTTNAVVSERTRRFARRSAIAALVLGMAGQVAYHLLAQAGVDHAPWEVTTVVACLPVLVLGMGSALAHLLRGDSAQCAVSHPGRQPTGQAYGYATGPAPRGQESPVTRPASDTTARPPARLRVADLQVAAAAVIASGQPISRRSLRAAGLRGSNTDLGMLARQVRASTIRLRLSGPRRVDEHRRLAVMPWLGRKQNPQSHLP